MATRRFALYLLLHPHEPQLFTLGFLMIILLVYLYSLSNKQNQSYWKMIGSTEKLRKQTQELVEARNEAVKANNARAEFLAQVLGHGLCLGRRFNND